MVASDTAFTGSDGVLTSALAPALPDGTSLTATDLNEQMLAQAKPRLAGKSQVKWQQADALALPFGDASFDIVACQFGVMFFPDKIEGVDAPLIPMSPQWRMKRRAARLIAAKSGCSIATRQPPNGQKKHPMYGNNPDVGRLGASRQGLMADRQQRDLFESERNFRLMVEGVADYALYMLDPTGTITSWNTGAQRIKGYAPEEILGRHFSRFYTETDRGNDKPTRALKIAKEQGRYEEDGWRVRKDGTFFWASVVIDPIYEDGKLVGFAKITRDITERRNAQLKLEQIQKQLAESQKLDALGQLTGGVAHDFNNLLMVITGSIHTLKKGIGDDAKLQRAAAAIETATRRGAALTSQLLTFARRQNVNPQRIDVAERIEAVREVLATGVGGAVKLSFDTDRATWPITVDAAEFETALVNLVINARDAMPEGGTITIGAYNLAIRGEAGAGDYVAIGITDTGTGIAPDLLDKIFEPFFTTKPIGKGTGLGLSQVHGFAHQAGGTVKVESQLGKGTTVTVLLPREQTYPQTDRSETVTEAAGSGTVLLVEDNPDVASASIVLLEQLGYTVRRVPDAEAALRDLEYDDIDLVFSDIVMPGKMDGLALARHLKEIRPNLPVLLATGYGGAAANVRGEFFILRKPYEIHQLSKAIAKLLE